MLSGEIIRVSPGSLAEELELAAGDKILAVNGQELRDIIDLSFAFAEEEIELLVEHADGEQELLAFDKDCDEELGVEFASAVFDGIRSCGNHCYFCFVDQVPPGMRKSLSVKDDDYRMSFLYGNFVTLTNMRERDFQRIERYHLSPLFVSVHAMNPDLRAAMLNTKRAAEIVRHLDRLDAADVEYHTQVVLCPGLNDGKELDRTVAELLARQPHALSLAVVPVGLTRFRDGCYPLKMFDRAGAAAVIRQIETWQRRAREETGKGFVYLGDEFYFLAGLPVPPVEAYDGFPQLDNGIGLARNFIEEWKKAVENFGAPKGYDAPLHLVILSGTSVAPLFRELVAEISVPGLAVDCLGVENDYFGRSVNVSGLLTGEDMLRALAQLPDAPDGVILPESALRTGENILLDDMTLEAFRRAVPQLRVETAQGGSDLARALLDWENYRGVADAAASYMWQSNAAYTKPREEQKEGME
ncbi:DUF512 domain-containing protein [Selenomonas sp.]|uniref:DUF512 domain-containing protein n=1 Tax=Selenomonas sp. TaxID=2053611 RepID=UPI003FA2EDBE